jgi:hypothetical protein
VLREWVEAAGGWSDAAAVYLPSCLPAGLALARLKAHARALGIGIHGDNDAREVERLLAAGRRAVESPDALADTAEATLKGLV